MDNTNITTIYLVRHGESESNVNHEKDIAFHSQWGEQEAPLTKIGREQAKKRALELEKITFDAVFSSDLTRAKQTAEIIKLNRQLAIQTTQLIRERSYLKYLEAFHGKTSEERKSEMRLALSTLDEKGKMRYKPGPDVESPEESVARMITFLREIAVAYTGKNVLVINHGNNIKSLLNHLGYATFDEMAGDAIVNTGYVVIQSDGVDFFVKETHGITKKTGEFRTF